MGNRITMEDLYEEIVFLRLALREIAGDSNVYGDDELDLFKKIADEKERVAKQALMGEAYGKRIGTNGE